MKYKHVEASREIRLWIGQIIVPAVTTVLMVSPEAREWTARKIQNVVHSIKTKFKK